MPIRSFDPEDYVKEYTTIHCCKCDSDSTFYGNHNPIYYENGVRRGYICQKCYDTKSFAYRAFDKGQEWFVQATISLVILFFAYLVISFLFG